MDGSLPAGQLPLCRGCGVVGPLQASRCEHCQGALGEPRWWQPVAQQGLLWARVEASFECRACGHRSALNHLDVDGQPLQPGSPCVIYASGTGDAFEELHVSCGSALLYDSTTQIMGLRMLDRELYRSEIDQPPNGLRYHDTGQRTNGSEITLDTRVGQAVISSQVVPLFRVELGPHREPKAKANAKR